MQVAFRTFCFASLILVCPGLASAHPQESIERIRLEGMEVVGTLLSPHVDEPVPCAIVVGGTMSHDRDGKMFKEGAPPRDALKRFSTALLAGGYASFRYDPVGSGASRATIPWKGTYHQQADVVRGLVEHFRGDARFSKLILVGESAGAYVICLAAGKGSRADATVFLGAYCGSPEELYEFNFARLAEFAAQSATNDAWARKHARIDLALGSHYREMFDAARDGRDSYEIVDGDFRVTLDLARRREEIAAPAPDQFRNLRGPVLFVAGARDRNVPPEHCQRAAELVRNSGNEHVTAMIIPGVDHSFQQAPDDELQQIHNRYSQASFRQPYGAAAYWAVLNWLEKNEPTPVQCRPEQVEMAAARAMLLPAEARAQSATEIDAVTDTTPKRVFLARGIEIIPEITDPKETAGVDTLEGRIGPLILGEGSQAHFIDMPGGMYVEEHPHSSESIIYTVRGQWALCSDGRRHLMKPGTLFRFAANIPTGYEVPFRENAYILIFKGDRQTKIESDFIQYLQGMAQRLEREHQQGVPFSLNELPFDHAARKHAREVNPRFEMEFGKDGP